MTAYLRIERRFDRSITDFSRRHPDQNETDYRSFVDAVGIGRIPVVEGV
jgi:hypothetical protein